MKIIYFIIFVLSIYGTEQKSFDKSERANNNDISSCQAPGHLVCIGVLDANQKFPATDLSLYYMCNRDGSTRLYGCPCDQLFDYNRQQCAYPPVHIACRNEVITNRYPYPCYVPTTTTITTTPPWVPTTTTTTYRSGTQTISFFYAPPRPLL